MGGIEVVLSVIVSAISIIMFVVTFIKNAKNKSSVKTYESAVLLNQVIANVPKYIKEAEAIFGGGTALAKINYVLNKLQIDCVKVGTNYDEDLMKSKIEEILETPQKKLKQSEVI